MSGVPWDKAADHVRQERTVTGRVESATFAKETTSTPTYLNVGRPYPDERRFVAVIFGDDRGNFRRPPEATYEGKDIAVTGEITLVHDIPQVIVTIRTTSRSARSERRAREGPFEVQPGHRAVAHSGSDGCGRQSAPGG